MTFSHYHFTTLVSSLVCNIFHVPEKPGCFTLIHCTHSHVGTAENQRQFEEAMKNGHVKAWLCKLLMYGHAGSGKTTSMEIIVGNKPPEHRVSTPLATRPTTIYRVNLDSEEWAKLSTLNDHKSLLARALIRDAPELVDRLLAARSNEDPTITISTQLKAEPRSRLDRSVELHVNAFREDDVDNT